MNHNKLWYGMTITSNMVWNKRNTTTLITEFVYQLAVVFLLTKSQFCVVVMFKEERRVDKSNIQVDIGDKIAVKKERIFKDACLGRISSFLTA